jgi:hypothetical protein
VLIRFITKKNVKTPKLSNPTENIGMSANKSSIYESSKVKDPIEIQQKLNTHSNIATQTQ